MLSSTSTSNRYQNINNLNNNNDYNSINRPNHLSINTNTTTTSNNTPIINLTTDSDYTDIAALPLDTTNQYMLQFYNMISCLACIAILITFSLQLMIIIIYTSTIVTIEDIIHLLYRVFNLSFSLISLCCELEWTEFIRTSTILQYWISRGCFYLYIGIIVYKEKESLIVVGIGSVSSASSIFLDQCMLGSSIAMGFFGIVYIIMGMCCFKQVRDQKMVRYMQILSAFEEQHDSETSLYMKTPMRQ